MGELYPPGYYHGPAPDDRFSDLDAAVGLPPDLYIGGSVVRLGTLPPDILWVGRHGGPEALYCLCYYQPAIRRRPPKDRGQWRFSYHVHQTWAQVKQRVLPLQLLESYGRVYYQDPFNPCPFSDHRGLYLEARMDAPVSLQLHP